MEIINTQITGDVVVTHDTQFNNLLCDDIIVEKNVITRLFGIVQKDIIIKKGSTTYLHGRIEGEIINQGGVLYIFLPNGQVVSY